MMDTEAGCQMQDAGCKRTKIQEPRSK